MIDLQAEYQPKKYDYRIWADNYNSYPDGEV